MTYAGFFGYIGEKGTVHNLIIDCVVNGKGNYAAPLCGWNEGIITDCITRSVCYSSRYSGGFAGYNGGSILRCCAHGRIKKPLIVPWWVKAACLFIVFIVVPVIMGIRGTLVNSDKIFAPVIMDPNAKPIEKEEEIISKPEEETSDSSTAFIMNADMDISHENYVGEINLKCPPWSTKGFVATAYASANDLSKNGSTYTEDAAVYTSGLIGPGMGVDVVTLSSLPDGTMMPVGHYTLTVKFEFYDMETNECSSVNTTAPIEVNIF